jgi:UDP-N-acetylglucosamine diphosphorylase / glucose-1-phosphate thymidylyltransferase / UDP-N-acetylgalactosamine diphosphorylase / glucosamine-1-phosphate N-acetyltransferase / galactosamine-1-phosphate N-acetyltransferase
MKIVIPMAGRGQRFLQSGILTPKPLIDVLGSPMLAWAMKSLSETQPSKIIFILLKEHDREYDITKILQKLYGTLAEVVVLDEVTEGQLATVMRAKNYIDDDEDILVSNCDTFVVSELHKDIILHHDNCAGIISTANLPGDRWSFAQVDENDYVTDVSEKVRISNHASTGLYYFSHGNQLVDVAEEIISRREKIKEEYYVIAAYQKYIQRGWKVKISRAKEMWDMGTPESLEEFKKYILSKRHDT